MSDTDTIEFTDSDIDTDDISFTDTDSDDDLVFPQEVIEPFNFTPEKEDLVDNLVLWEFGMFNFNSDNNDMIENIVTNKIDILCKNSIGRGFLKGLLKQDNIKGYIVQVDRDTDDVDIDLVTIGMIFFTDVDNLNIAEIKLLCVNKVGLKGSVGLPVGKLLIEFAEQISLDNTNEEFVDMELNSVLKSVNFYKSIGYKQSNRDLGGGLIHMEKRVGRDTEQELFKRFNDIKNKDTFIRENKLIKDFVNFFNEEAEDVGDRLITESDNVDEVLRTTKQKPSDILRKSKPEETLFVEFFENHTTIKEMKRMIKGTLIDKQSLLDMTEKDTKINILIGLNAFGRYKKLGFNNKFDFDNMPEEEMDNLINKYFRIDITNWDIVVIYFYIGKGKNYQVSTDEDDVDAFAEFVELMEKETST